MHFQPYRNALDMIIVSWLIQYCSTFMVPEISNDAGLKVTSPGIIGQNDLLIVGPGVLGRMVAEKWRKVWLKCLEHFI